MGFLKGFVFGQQIAQRGEGEDMSMSWGDDPGVNGKGKGEQKGSSKGEIARLTRMVSALQNEAKEKDKKIRRFERENTELSQEVQYLEAERERLHLEVIALRSQLPVFHHNERPQEGVTRWWNFYEVAGEHVI